MDDELFKLCKEVSTRTGWKDTLAVYEQTAGIPEGEPYVAYPELERYWGLWGTQELKTHTPLYTSDYILAKLIEEGIEVTLQYIPHDTALSIFRGRSDLLGKYTAYTPYMKMGEYTGSKLPLIALLELVLFLGITSDDIGELK